MSASTVGLFLRHLALSQEVSRLGTASDRDLLAAYDPERGQAAFTELVRRYGPMVLRTCRRVLGHGPDAEDAFQATFVLLARQAGQLSREAKAPLSLGGWLHRVAHRTAVNVLSQSARRRAREQQTRVMNQPNADPVAEATWNEVRPILDAELEALPDESRRLLVACYLQGKTHAEAAFELDLPLGSVARRLDKARSLMAARLTRRGITVSATLLAVLLGETGKGAEVPAVLLVHTVEAARRFTEQAAGSISENVFRLVRGGLAQMTTNGSTYMSVALVGCMALLGAGLIVSQTLKAWPEPTPSSGEPVTATAPEPSATRQEKQKATDRFSDPLPSGTLARMGTVCLRHATGLFWMSFTEDGKGMVTAGVWNPARLWDVASVWDAASGEQQRQLRADGDHFFCSGIASITSTISSDGNTLASASWQRNFEAWKGEIQYRLWDRSSGRELRRWSQDLNNFAPRWFVFSPDGKSVACARYDKSPPYRVHLRDAATGKERARVVGSYAAFSPDIKLLATAPEYDSAGPFFTLWDAATGNEICSVSSLPEGYRLQRLLFSPDGRMLATASSCNRSNMEPSGIHLWPLFRDDPASEGRHPPVERSEQDSDVRRSRVRVGSPRVLAARGLPFVDIYRPSGFNAWAFSPDGRTLALCGEGGTVRLVETVSGKERSRFTGHGGDVTALAFAPDGRRLASGSRDTTVLVWDVTGRLHQGQLRRTQLSTKQLQRYWADLAGADAGRAGSAIWALASDPSRSVPFLTEQLRTAAEEVKKRLVGVPQLIRDLDDDAFAVRENAKTELARLGEAAEPALLRALAKSPSPELRRSLKQLLETVEAHRRVPVDASLRCLRAVETLEQIADGESRSTLKALASDAPMDSAVALEARAALERLQRR